MKLIRRVADAAMWVAMGVVSVAASAWVARSTLLEIAGGALIVAAAWSVSHVAGLAVAGGWLSLQAYGVRRGERRAP